MRINNSLPLDPKSGLVTGAPSAEDTARIPSAAVDQPAQGSVYTTAPEFLQLLDLVRRTPEVRPELLQEVAQRLASGDYLTPEAANRTAGAILSSPPL